MCVCAKNTAVMRRTDFTQTLTTEKSYFKSSAADATLTANIVIIDLSYNARQGGSGNSNDLKMRAKRLSNKGGMSAEPLEAVEGQLVGNGAGKCNAAIEAFLGTHP